MYRCSKCGRVFNDGELKMFSHIHDRLPCGDRYCDILPAAELEVPADRSFARIAAAEPQTLGSLYPGVEMRKTVFLLTYGDGSDGNEWNVISIHSTFELATIAKEKYEAPVTRHDGSTYSRESQIEEWVVDE